MNKLVDIGEWTILKISGNQRDEYLDGIVPNNLQEIKISRSLILNPKGKIQVIFWIERIEKSYILYVPPSMRDVLISLLLKFKLSMDIILEDISNETSPLYLKSSEKYISGLGYFDFIHIKNHSGETMSYEEFTHHLILNDEVPSKLLLNENPLEVGLFDTIYLPKGCFLGQEPLSRMINIGRPRSFLYHIQTDAISDVLISDDVVIGNIFYKSNNHVIIQCKSTISNFDSFKSKYNICKMNRIGNYPDFNRL